MKPLAFQLLLGAYTVLLYLATPFYLLRLVLRCARDPRAGHRWLQRLGIYSTPRPAPSTIWLHAVSVGEIASAAQVIERLRTAYPQRRLLVTTTTLTSAQWLQDRYGQTIDHRYLPLDLPGAAARFLRHARPAIGVVMESEVWPNLFLRCRRQGIPLLLLNARLSDRSYRRYRKINRSGLLNPLLSSVQRVVAQSEADAQRFREVFPATVAVSHGGNLKYDAAIASATVDAAIGRLSGSVWIAGSTHPGEEAAVVRAHAEIRSARADARLIWAPRHPARADAIAGLCAARGFSVARRSQGAGVETAAEVLILDTIGELARFYRAAQVAFIGGTLVPVGGHNPLEAVVRNVPVVAGRQVHNFRQVYETLDRARALTTSNDGAQLGAAVLGLLTDPVLRAARALCAQRALGPNQGATDRAMLAIATILAQRPERVAALTPHLPQVAS